MEHFSKRVSVFALNDDETKSGPMHVDDSAEDSDREEDLSRLSEQWRYDDDDEAADEEQRTLIDDYDLR